MNRRNVLVGIGTAAVGSGVALGSGAFTSVEATRNVNLDTSNDNSASLQLEAGSGATSIVGTETDQGVDMIELDETSLNEDAITRFDQAISVTNNGSQNVGLYVSTGTGLPDPLDIEESAGGTTIVGSGDSVNLETGSGNSIELNVVVDLTGTTTNSDLPSDITLNAEAGQYSPP
jgi:hypothetical protein